MVENKPRCEQYSGDDKLIKTLMNRAYRLLVRREYSAQELRKKFTNMASSDVIEAVLIMLVNEEAQSDVRFAEMLCRSRFNNGKGPIRLRRELNQSQIDPDVIESAMVEYEDKWPDSAKQVRKQKYGDEPPTSFKEWARQARFLQQRGFTSDQIGTYQGKSE